MASDNHAHYSKIGFAVSLGTVAIIATLIWLGGVGSGEEPVFAETYYEKSISGLSVGSAINFRGVPFGKVARIDFVGNNYELRGRENGRIYILMALDRHKFDGRLRREGQTPEDVLRKLAEEGMRATVTASGITGLSHIEFDFYPDAAPPPKLSWTPRFPYIPPKVSFLEDFSSVVTRVMNQINGMDFVGVWSNISLTVEHVAESTRSARMLLDDRRTEIGQIIDGMSETVDSLKELSSELKRNPSALIRERRVEPLDETR